MEAIQKHFDPDKEILELLNDSNSREQGFRLLVSTYQERMYWQIRKMVIDHDDTNDVLQNAFIKVSKGIQNFKGDSKLYTWLHRISINESITFLNKKKKKATTSIDREDTGLEHTLKADQYFDGNEVEILLQQALDTLPDKQRQVFLLRYESEMSYQAISDLLGTSIGGLKASYHHAVRKIESFIKAR